MTDKTPIENKIPTRSKQSQKAFKIYIGFMPKWHFSFKKIQHKSRQEKNKLPRGSNATTNKPSTLYTLMMAQSIKEKGLS